MEDLSQYTGEDEIISSIELYERLNKNKDKSFLVKTKFPTLNELIEGFNMGELTVISGLTGHGKTLLGQTLTEDFSNKGIYSLWFTYELPMLQFLKQFGLPIPHFYMPQILKDKSLNWIYNKILEAKQKFDIKAVFIDHLHFLADIMMLKNTSLEIGQVMRTLKGWALELELMIFIVAHTMKVKPDKELDAGDTRDCLPEEQIIYSNGKRVPVKNILIGDKVLSRGSIKTLQEDVIINKWDTGIKNIYRLTTKTGREIECSDGHKFYALTYKKGKYFGSNQGTGIAEWIPLRELKIGQKIAIPKKYPNTNIEDITPEQASVLGWLIGDGHITKQFNSEITTNTLEEAIYIKSIADKGWNLNCKIYPYKNKNAYRIYLTNSEITNKNGRRGKNNLLTFLKNINFNPVGNKKYIPEFIFEQSYRIINSFLQGLFHADGSITKNKNNEIIITLNTVSEQLSKDIQSLLIRTGIIGWRRKQSMKKAGFRTENGYIWDVNIYGQGIIDFKNIGFFCEKERKYYGLIENWIPKENKKKTDIYFDKIKSIEYIGKKKTFDISVRGHHASLKNNSFCVSDFITHNSSFIEQESDNVFFIWRSKNKENEAVLKITKNRNMGVMNKKIKLIKKDKFLVELINSPSVDTTNNPEITKEGWIEETFNDNFGIDDTNKEDLF